MHWIDTIYFPDLVSRLADLDVRLAALGADAHSSPDPDAFGILDEIENAIGEGFFHCQHYMTHRKGTIRDAYSCGTRFRYYTFATVINTGANYSTLSANTAKFQFGVTADSPGSTPMGSFDGNPDHKVFGHVFSSLTFDGVTVTNPHVAVIPDLVGSKEGGNPHRWYSPDDVHQVIEQITAEYKKIDPADASYFDEQQATYETVTLAAYNKAISDIKATYAGTPIGASESIVSPLAEDLGLKMLTPDSFLTAISEGSDPTARDKATIDQQIKGKQIKVYVYNSQNSTPDVQEQVKEAEASGIPVATVTETMTPAGTTFQDWQTAQLDGIAAALAKATGK